MTNFIVEFPLKTEKYQEDILNKRFEIGRQIYNSLVNITQKRYREMIKTKKYRNLFSSITGNMKLYRDDKCFLYFATEGYKEFIIELLKNHKVGVKTNE